MTTANDTKRLRNALTELPGLPLRVEESMKDGYGAVSDTGEVPTTFLFRNCSDAEAEGATPGMWL